MSPDLFLQYLTQALFVLITLVVVAQAVRHPTRAKVDIALFFGVTALVIAEGWAFAALGITAGAALRALNGSLVMALPYLLLRLVSDFAAVPSRTLRAAEVGWSSRSSAFSPSGPRCRSRSSCCWSATSVPSASTPPSRSSGRRGGRVG